MKKILPFLFLAILTAALTSSCQDEFCLDPTTPNLIIRFYDKDVVTEKKSIELKVWVENKDTIYNGVSTDSIYLPIDTKNSSVVYHIKSDDITEDITLSYTVEDKFVSKACGFKSIFNNITVNTTNNGWLNSFTTTTSDITNQNQAHVKIFH
ncbi:hypothetical protein AXE80_04765 [Wenyingzhuangia fucanilytica]|uniref:Uncharacterized protein n=1 Tax=Wenyingzhuangia fucanilytica TaxID=1790137 RepID=A0A1B1Y4C9_9FLAO|nr:DUF6452 family protein [Wenyingzhuangia fucanilytica]ANW95631.1 hypothetical protein AXE80_04765 [Wenyingzhuangia fucanilytica]